MKIFSFYYGTCLMVAGLIVGLVLGLAFAGATAEYPLSNTVVIVLTIAFVVGVFVDWKEKFDGSN